MTPAAGSLCTGYGGLDLAVEQHFGTRLAWVSEYEPPTKKCRRPKQSAARVLAHRFPAAANLGDLTGVDWSAIEPVEILTAGYPCQPFSYAGNRKGTSDERHLWPFIADAIRTLRPRLVFLENVAAHLSLGLDVVIGDLAQMGYRVLWGVVRASDAGNCHERSRVFIAATDAGVHRRQGSGCGAPADAHRPGLQGSGWPIPAAPEHTALERAPVDWGIYEPAIRRWEHFLGRPAPAPTRPGLKGKPTLCARFEEWLMGLPAGWVTDVPGISHTAQKHMLGNGVVPQQASLALRLLTGAA